MNKAIVLIIVILLSPLIGGLYGMLHDQITYTISEEYYTKFKFFQFGIPEYFRDRFGVSIVGFLATWWMGLPIGIIIGLTGLIQKDYKSMTKATVKAFLVAIILTLVVPLIAVSIWFVAVWFQVSPSEGYVINLPDFVPDNERVINGISFYAVGLIHNFSYLGGIVGLIGGVITQIRYKMKNKSSR